MSKQPDELEDLRRQIDELDGRLLKLLAERMSKVEAIGKYKQAHNLPLLDEQRWQTVIEARLETAKALGLSDDFIARLYDLVHDYALKVESDR